MVSSPYIQRRVAPVHSDLLLCAGMYVQEKPLQQLGARAADATDEELMAAYVQQGDKAAFRVLFERHAGRLRGFFLRGTGNAEVAADMVQTTFMHVHRARNDFQLDRPFKPWMYAIAANVRREYWRRRHRRPEEPLTPAMEDRVGSTAPDVSSASDRLVRRALTELPDNQRDVMLLRWYGGLTFPEIAASLGIKTTAAKVRAHRATKVLRSILGVDDAN